GIMGVSIKIGPGCCQLTSLAFVRQDALVELGTVLVARTDPFSKTFIFVIQRLPCPLHLLVKRTRPPDHRQGAGSCLLHLHMLTLCLCERLIEGFGLLAGLLMLGSVMLQSRLISLLL